jgi:eukaryotic-like serine/threonine-protein kinase
MPVCPQCRNEYDGGTHLCAPPTAPDDDPFVISRVYEPGVVLGSYLLKRLIGEGAIGRVYQAEHRTLGRQVALKVLRSEFAEKPMVVKRFFGEARAVQQIAHENIVEITDFVQQENGSCYYIMELLEGETLETRFRRTGAIPQYELIRIALQITSALQAVHDQMIVHRDLKPENVFLTTKGDLENVVKVLDFGVAKLARGRNTAHTVAGMLVGTPDYMSPEQAVGGEVDHRADIYSLGALLYEMSTGRKVFVSSSIRELLDLHLDGRVIPPCELVDLPQPLHPRFEALVMRCLAKEPSKRPQSMREVESELRAIGDETNDLVRVVVTDGRRPNALAIAAVMVLLLVPMVAMIAAVSKREERPVTIAPQVSIRIDTEPPGARVIHVESARDLGSTPLSTVLVRSNQPQTFRLLLPGFEAIDYRVTPDEPHRATIALRPQRGTAVNRSPHRPQ